MTINQYFDFVKKVRDYMRKNNIFRLYLNRYNQNFSNKESIMFNKYPSPNGAKGMFIISSRYNFELEDMFHFLNNKYNLQDIYKNEGKRLQDKFERFTEKIFDKYLIKYEYVPQEKMSDYDYKIIYNGNEYTIEIKSDKWLKTGNLSLELMRDYQFDYERNVGSILKTKADYWLFYFYDYNTGEVISEIYSVNQLKNYVYDVLNLLKQKGIY